MECVISGIIVVSQVLGYWLNQVTTILAGAARILRIFFFTKSDPTAWVWWEKVYQSVYSKQSIPSFALLHTSIRFGLACKIGLERKKNKKIECAYIYRIHCIFVIFVKIHLAEWFARQSCKQMVSGSIPIKGGKRFWCPCIMGRVFTPFH